MSISAVLDELKSDAEALKAKIEGLASSAAQTLQSDLAPEIAKEIANAEPVVIATLMAVLGDHLPKPILDLIGPNVKSVLTTLVADAIAAVEPTEKLI